MPHKSYNDRKRWLSERLARMTKEERENRRLYFAGKARETYWKNPERYRVKSKTNRQRGIASKNQANQRERLTPGYVRRCLKQRAWSDEEIDHWIRTPELLETLRVHIKAKREIRKWQSTI